MNTDSPEVLHRIGGPPTARERKRGKGTLVAVVAVASVLLLGVGGAILWFALQQFKAPLHEALVAGATSRLEKARDTCAPNSIYAEVGDDGDTLILRFRGEERSGLDMSTMDCFMTELEVTDAVRSEIGATRALDGRRSADWGGYHGSWSYHPDTGLNMTITMR